MKYKGVERLAKKIFEEENQRMIIRALLAIGGPECVQKFASKPMNKKAKDFWAVMGRRLYISGQSITDEVLKFFEDEEVCHGRN